MLLLANKSPYREKRPALFLDRDGVVNKDYGYVCESQNFDFVDGIFELVSSANIAGYWTIIVTNQSGIGRGLYTLEHFYELSIWMCKCFEKNRAHLDAIYYSPFHPTAGKGEFLLRENTRKPGTGMFLEACNDFEIHLPTSIMIGDKLSDMQASMEVGIKNNYMLAPSPKRKSSIRNEKIKMISALSEVSIVKSLRND